MKSNKLEEIKKKIIPILRKNKVSKAGIFGSYARGEQKKKSDVDVLIEIKQKPFSLFDLVGLEMELEKILGIKVDLLTYKAISPYLRKDILADEVRII